MDDKELLRCINLFENKLTTQAHNVAIVNAAHNLKINFEWLERDFENNIHSPHARVMVTHAPEQNRAKYVVDLLKDVEGSAGLHSTVRLSMSSVLSLCCHTCHSPWCYMQGCMSVCCQKPANTQ